jgi:hypothetical protein
MDVWGSLNFVSQFKFVMPKKIFVRWAEWAATIVDGFLGSPCCWRALSSFDASQKYKSVDQQV